VSVGSSDEAVILLPQAFYADTVDYGQAELGSVSFEVSGHLVLGGERQRICQEGNTRQSVVLGGRKDPE
jgi:hypothetical protein